MTKTHGLGRISSPDSRDHRFLLSALLKEEPLPNYRYWYNRGWRGDQGETSQCVAYAWLHWISSAPQTSKLSVIEPSVLYKRAQELDPWPGEDYDGTDTRAGAKALQEKGFIQSYWWAFDINTVIQAVLTAAPVVVGTNWYADMFTPNSDGFIIPNGEVEGGHAYLINGVNAKRRVFRIQNSWGKSWGINGSAYISFDDMERLLLEDGEAVLGIETRPKL